MKSFYRHDHKINRKKQDKEDKEKIKTKSISKDLKGGGETYDFDRNLQQDSGVFEKVRFFIC